MKTVHFHVNSKHRAEKDVKNNFSKNKVEILRKLITTLRTSHQAIVKKSLVLLFAQLFGVMPVTGVKAKDIRGLSFSYFSIIFIYSLIVFISLAFYFSTTLIVIKAFLDPVIFYGSIVCIYYKFGNLARQWPKLMQKWEKIERNLPEHPTQLSKAALAQRIKMVAIVVLMMSLIEHLLNIITIVHYANYCNTGQDPVQQVFKSQLSQLFYITEFSVFKAIFGKLVNVIATFTWNYMDLFVMVVSIGLSDKFRQVNASLFRMKGKVTSESYWSQHRDHYRSLCRLCEDIDNAISFITMFSFSNNLYFICVQLLRSLNKMPSFAHTLYFWFSLVFLIGRTLAVSLYSAEINDESKRPVQVFRCVPKESWCLEVKRFSEEVNTDIVALSGMKFFHLTRTLVLSVAGTIVTYELVLIQFHVQEGYLGCYYSQTPPISPILSFLLLSPSRTLHRRRFACNSQAKICNYILLQRHNGILLIYGPRSQMASTHEEMGGDRKKFTKIPNAGGKRLSFSQNQNDCFGILSIVVTRSSVKQCFGDLKQISFALEYTTWKAIVVEIVSIIATFVSSYVDVFVMVVCIGISERFQQVNRRIIAVKWKVIWKGMQLGGIPIKNLLIRRKKINLKPNNPGKQKSSPLLSTKSESLGHSAGFKYLRRATKEDFMYNGSFHEAVGTVLLIAQFFAIMPVRGVKSKNANGLSFRWCCFPALYTGIVLIFLAFYFILTIYFVFATNNFELADIDPIIFQGSCLCVCGMFANLARKWPGLMRKWHDIEVQLPDHQSQMHRAALAYKIKMIVLLTVVMSLIEHLLSIISNIHYINYCKTGEEPFETFFRIHLFHMFAITDYAIWKAIFGKFLNIIGTFVWTYMDIFVMVVSVGLSEKFRQVNKSLFRIKGKMMPESFWYEHRMHYRNLCNLCEDVDNAISQITMVSFSNNVYFICAQLLKSLNPMPSVAHAVYFWFSMIFLLARTLAVSLYSAEINDQSKKPVEIFRCVPKESWCLEVKRFSQEVNSDTIALTGMRFFYLTRGLVLSVGGTIVTYELVLFQFNVGAGVHTTC
ncbi:uncharacterized protein LOC119648542 [Hermetia illucens]|uniref:uncharacterized protein LOC119648542 n=1 Tax=Hermetia illucens TaxID=343691 RepID=UPI0018CC695A|nr:uncharacterized protein LOC119648542 [Hermetia illucens]